VEHFVDWLAGQAGGVGTEQTRSSGIGKADVPLAVHAANAVGNRVEQDLLLPVKLLRRPRSWDRASICPSEAATVSTAARASRSSRSPK